MAQGLKGLLEKHMERKSFKESGNSKKHRQYSVKEIEVNKNMKNILTPRFEINVGS